MSEMNSLAIGQDEQLNVMVYVTSSVHSRLESVLAFRFVFVRTIALPFKLTDQVGYDPE